MKRKIAFLTLFFSLSLILVGCNGGETTGNKPVVYTSFYPIKDLVKSIAGDTLEVRSFMPENKEPHLWEPTPKDMKKLAKADLLVVNGANLESWLPLVRDALPNLPVLVLSDSVELITYRGAAAIGDFQYMAEYDAKKSEKYKIYFGHTHEDLMRIAFIENNDNKSFEELVKLGKKTMEQKGALVRQKSHIDVEPGAVYSIEMGHESGEITYNFPNDGKWVFVSDRLSERLLSYDLLGPDGDKLDVKSVLEGSTSSLDKITYDPHSWLSVKNAKRYINSIFDEFVKRYPENEDLYKRAKTEKISELTDLEFGYRDKFKNLKLKEFVVTHNAYAYLARDFELRQFPLQGLVSTETPSLKTIRKAVDFCQFYGIKTVFYEYNGQKKGADTVASEIGGKSVPLASMEYSDAFRNSELKGYVDIMRMNLENLLKSMEEVK